MRDPDFKLPTIMLFNCDTAIDKTCFAAGLALKCLTLTRTRGQRGGQRLNKHRIKLIETAVNNSNFI